MNRQNAINYGQRVSLSGTNPLDRQRLLTVCGADRSPLGWTLSVQADAPVLVGVKFGSGAVLEAAEVTAHQGTVLSVPAPSVAIEVYHDPGRLWLGAAVEVVACLAEGLSSSRAVREHYLALAMGGSANVRVPRFATGWRIASQFQSALWHARTSYLCGQSGYTGLDVQRAMLDGRWLPTDSAETFRIWMPTTGLDVNTFIGFLQFRVEL